VAQPKKVRTPKKGDIEMEGKELWALLDVVKELRERGDILEKTVGEEETSVEEQNRIKSNAKIYRDIADKLENLLQKVISYNRASFF
jgi:hypothetical protein